jgi:hypothetical protein
MTNQTQGHTPTPWTASEDQILSKDLNKWGNWIVCEMPKGRDEISEAVEENKANAAYIVKCVNSHEELLEALKEAHAMLENIGIEKGQYYGKAINKVEQAILKAEGNS